MGNVKIPLDLKSLSSIHYQYSRYLIAANVSPRADAPDWIRTSESHGCQTLRDIRYFTQA